ncbi:hypothetical protein Q0Z83_038850 [Actinoplanes sichuanensis]|uniref:DUF397 domain-containing protein n=1 Tax=Actinoplanes sichuanensis TaxID=512349 RepID=A0ABW4ATD8_9ACTN|nr:DUF397 domain-containing protein [Actinoplanes sichuanensis]BEL05694.1 hypothetical protein Q0Z83_038850 [Actinoplanes sichuanensis]
MANDDLYSVEVEDEAFRKLCGGNGLTLEGCVSIAEIPEHEGAFAIRDSKLGASSPTLRFSKAEMDDFFAAFSGDGAA